MKKWIVLALLIVGSRLETRSATLTVTPNVVSNDYTGLITFQLNGLSPGESVRLAQFYDFRANGIVDAPDATVRSEVITDGQVFQIGGATNANVLHDEDGATNGLITASFPFISAPELTRGVGTYLFQLSSPSNHFAATTQPFAVVSASYGQKVQGLVQSSGTNVPYAGVSLVLPSTDGVVFTVADANGSFSLPAPIGAYVLVAALPGYVMDFQAAPRIALAANATVTTNLTLIPATTSLSGTVVDEDNRTLPVLPNTQLTLFSTAQYFTISATDSNANFTVPVTPGVWTVRPAWQGAGEKSFLAPEPGSFLESSFDVTAGPVTGAIVPVKRSTALIYGTVFDSHGHPIPGITLSASADGDAFAAVATSDSKGAYALALDAGGGFINVQDLTRPPASGYLWSGSFFNLPDGQALNLNITGIVATATFHGQILDETGAPVPEFSFFANSNLGGTSLGNTDDSGAFTLPVFGGRWQLYPDGGESEQRGYIFPPYSFQVTDGVDLTNHIIVRKATGHIIGHVRDVNGVGLSGLTVTAQATVDAASYTLTAYTDANGAFALTAFNGSWIVSLGPYDLLARNFNPANPVSAIVPPTNSIADLSVVPLGPPGAAPRITNPNLPDAYLGQPYEQVLFVTNAVRSFSWDVIAGALPEGLRLDSSLGTISGKPVTLGPSTFTIQLTDARDTNVTSTLSINVRAAPLSAPAIDNPVRLSSNVFSLRVTSAASEHDSLQVSATLTNWVDLLSTNAPSNVYNLQDTQATNAMRFYRIKVNP